MNKQELQYKKYLNNLGYEPIFYPEKSLFHIKEYNIYLKVCEYPASEELKIYAAEKSKGCYIVLLEGNLTFRDYMVFHDGGYIEMESVLMHKDSKYAPFFYGEFTLEYFDAESFAIAQAINESDLICKRCGSVNDYKVEKNLHYKATCKCGYFITNISANKPVAIHFGKYASCYSLR